MVVLVFIFPRFEVIHLMLVFLIYAPPLRQKQHGNLLTKFSDVKTNEQDKREIKDG
jgi:hypothetical protein